jgi:hypothetical protein
MHNVFCGKVRRKDITRKTDIGGTVILKWILERQDGAVWIGLMWLKTGTSAGSCEHGSEPSDSMIFGDILQ